VVDARSIEGFDAYKRELLFDASDYTNGVYEAWWRANALFPERALSERLAMAEQAISDLLTAGLVVLIRDADDPKGSEVPSSDVEETLKRWDTWVIGSEGIKVHFTTTTTGEEVVNDGGSP
jgi:hypothetical protein